MNELALFAGAGGGILGGHLLGWRTVCAVEWEAYPASVLVARQNDKILPLFPIWDDVQTFDGKPWRGIVDVVSGGFPCQDISVAGGGMDLMEKEVECGKRWQGLLARYDHNTHSLRTVQCSLFEDLNQSLQIWPRWGSMRNGECWEQPMLVQTIKETEFGLSEKMWPTPNAWDGKRGPRSLENLLTKKHQINLITAVRHLSGTKNQSCGQLNPAWVEWLMGWPLEWTDLKPLEMDKSHFVQQQPGQS